MNLPIRVALLLFFVLLPRQCCSAETLRILSYNIHHGRGADGGVDLERIAGVIRQAKPDLVALNEVDNEVNRSGKVDQPAELGRLTEMTALFEKNIHYDGGEYGNAILSKHPVNKHENLALPSHYDGEQRGMLVAEVELPGGAKLWFAATHLDYRANDAERMESATAIDRFIGDRFADQRVVLAGDFNALPDSRVMAEFAKTWAVSRSGPTYPAEVPAKQIDYVLWRPAGAWRVVSAEVIDEPAASDHRPVLVVLDMLN